MTFPPNSKSCARLSQEVQLNLENFPFAAISPDPLYGYPKSLEEIRSTKDLETQPLFLDFTTGKGCVYPIRTSPYLEDSFSPAHIIEEKFGKTKIPYFGIPTKISTSTSGFKTSGVIYDPLRSYFYATELERGLQWYLVGDDSNFEGFTQSIELFASYLGELAVKEPSVLFEKAFGFAKAEKPPTVATPEDAARELNEFMKWLETYDPQLASDVKPRLSYSPQIQQGSWLEGFFCGLVLNNSTYAFYDTATKRISLMPKAVEMLKARQYEALAAILAHERAHMWSRESGIIMPSYELLHRSIDHFFGRIISAEPALAPLVALSDKVIRTGLQCVFLTVVPEEEVQAHAHDFSYSTSGLASEGTRLMQDQSLENIDHFWNFSSTYFPPGWVRLAMQYYTLAAEQHPPSQQPMNASLHLFIEDLKDRWDCVRETAGPCAKQSKAWDQLEAHRHPEIKFKSPTENPWLKDVVFQLLPFTETIHWPW